VLGGPRAPLLFVFSAGEVRYDRRDVDSQKRFLADYYRGAGWRTPELVDAALAAPDFYLDGLARTTMTTFSPGRSALVGDAGYANTLGGFGTGLALVGAYVLAGELVARGGDHRAAYAAYDQRMAHLTKSARKTNAGPFLAPPSPLRIRMRDLTFANRLTVAAMLKVTDWFATDEKVPDYPLV
jgi:2-polyprenyl-6-methoxyphenol hydroxylase-like FAD-dependent oxidoreductase